MRLASVAVDGKVIIAQGQVKVTDTPDETDKPGYGSKDESTVSANKQVKKKKRKKKKKVQSDEKMECSVEADEDSEDAGMNSECRRHREKSGKGIKMENKFMSKQKDKDNSDVSLEENVKGKHKKKKHDNLGADGGRDLHEHLEKVEENKDSVPHVTADKTKKKPKETAKYCVDMKHRNSTDVSLQDCVKKKKNRKSMDIPD